MQIVFMSFKMLYCMYSRCSKTCSKMQIVFMLFSVCYFVCTADAVVQSTEKYMQLHANCISDAPLL